MWGNQKTNWKYILIILILALLAGGATLFYWWQIKMGESNTPENLNYQKAEEPALPLDTTDWKTYKNETYGFEFPYPKDWYVKEGDGQFFLFDSSLCQGSCPTKNSQISFGIEDNSGLLSVSDWMRQNIGEIGNEQDQVFYVDNAKGVERSYKKSNNSIAAVLIVFPQKEELKTLYYFETAGLENRRILNQILLDFNFLK